MAAGSFQGQRSSEEEGDKLSRTLFSACSLFSTLQLCNSIHSSTFCSDGRCLVLNFECSLACPTSMVALSIAPLSKPALCWAAKEKAPVVREVWPRTMLR